MEKIYTLIDKEQSQIIIQLDDTDFDYYSNVTIELVLGQSHFVLYNDNLLALKNIIEHYDVVPTLQDNIAEENLGVLLNEYYRYLYEDQASENIVFDRDGQWIGEKYCCFSSLEYATWIYKYHDNMIIKVTPVFSGFEEDDYILQYNEFIQEYKDLYREGVSLQLLETIKDIILKLYNELLL